MFFILYICFAYLFCVCFCVLRIYLLICCTLCICGRSWSTAVYRAHCAVWPGSCCAARTRVRTRRSMGSCWNSRHRVRGSLVVTSQGPTPRTICSRSRMGLDRRVSSMSQRLLWLYTEYTVLCTIYYTIYNPVYNTNTIYNIGLLYWI